MIPIKHPTRGKSRLASVLSESERKQLVWKLLDHVVSAVQEVPQVDEIFLISDSDVIGHWAISNQIRWLKTPAPLNEAIQIGYSLAHEAGIDRVLVLPADLPFLTAQAVIDLLSHPHKIVIAPDRFNEGTNALLLQGTPSFVFQFGLYSFKRHHREALKMGGHTAIFNHPAVAFDLDWPEDLARWRQSAPGMPPRSI
ncbi:MAG: 2-phospho-L-lactate guanylyltransferase [Ardenticatenaceae bacterium]|nr:2-phospho-L-lactate guanylyltransferase [Ardenticatenaceae bacterium]